MKHKYLERSLNIWKKVWNLILQFVTSLQAQSSERTSHWKYREKFPCANWLGFSHNPGNIIGNNFVMGQKSVGHLVWSVEVEVRSLVPAFNRRKNKEKGDLCKGFSLSNLTLLTLDETLTIWHPQVKRSDLPIFYPLQSCFLWYSLHCVKISVNSQRGVFPYTSALVSFPQENIRQLDLSNIVYLSYGICSFFRQG
jgi:hypothetical protein